AVELTDLLSDAHEAEAAVEMEDERRAVLREDPRLQGPDPGPLRLGDEVPEERAPEAAPAYGRIDVDADVRDAAVAASVGVGRETDPADAPALVERDEPVLDQVGHVPGLPARHLRLEGGVPGRDPGRVDARDLRPVSRPEVADFDAGSRRS